MSYCINIEEIPGMLNASRDDELILTNLRYTRAFRLTAVVRKEKRVYDYIFHDEPLGKFIIDYFDINPCDMGLRIVLSRDVEEQMIDDFKAYEAL